MKSVSIRIDKDLLKALDRTAKTYGVTRSSLVRSMITDYVESEVLYKLSVSRLQDKNDPILTHKEFEKELRRSK